MSESSLTQEVVDSRTDSDEKWSEMVGQAFADFGFLKGLLYLLYRSLPLPSIAVPLENRYSRFPVLCRLGTSDVRVFRRIFTERVFSYLDDLDEPKLILDCGANVGYASAYFLSRYPRTFVIAVEPDPKNFAQLVKNLEPYEGRYLGLCSALWSKKTALKFAEIPNAPADGLRVQEVPAGEVGSIEGVSIDDLLALRKVDRIDLLKMNIEGSEAAIFSANYESWLAKVDNIAIELHGARERQIFEQAIAGQNFVAFQAHGLVICKRPVKA